MTNKHCAVVFVLLALVLVSCGGDGGGEVVMSEQQAVDAAWQALEPNTSSHDRGNWQTADVRQVNGQDVAQEFQGEPAPGCWKGPTPPANGSIGSSRSYWYVQMKPRPVTPIPEEGEISPTAPPNVPEPFVQQALFLFDAGDGSLVARKLFCVIY